MAEPTPLTRAAFERRMGFAFAASFLTIGLFNPFFPVWLEGEGLDAGEIGIILAAQIALRVLVSPLVLGHADRAKDRANVLLAFAFASATAALLLFVANGFAAILLATLVLSALWASVIPLTDAIALSGVRRLSIDYGRTRVWGSIAFIAANVAGGLIVNRFGTQWFLPILFASFLMAALLTLAVPRVGRPQRASPPPISQASEPWLPARPFWARRPSLQPAADVRRLLPILFAIGLIQASHALFYGFGSIHWTQLGYSPSAIGVLWAVGVVAEIVLFRFATSLVRRIGIRRFLVAAGSLAALRWSLFGLDLGFFGFVLLQMLHAFSFGATHLALQSIIACSVAEERLGTVQGTAFALQTILMAIATIVAGSAFAVWGAGSFLLMAAMALSGAVIAALSRGAYGAR